MRTIDAEVTIQGISDSQSAETSRRPRNSFGGLSGVRDFHAAYSGQCASAWTTGHLMLQTWERCI